MSATPIPISDLILEAVTTPEEILIRCSGRIVSSTAGSFQTKVRSLIPEAKSVVLDLTDARQIDSSGLGALVKRVHVREAARLRVKADQSEPAPARTLPHYEVIFSVRGSRRKLFRRVLSCDILLP